MAKDFDLNLTVSAKSKDFVLLNTTSALNQTITNLVNIRTGDIISDFSVNSPLSSLNYSVDPIYREYYLSLIPDYLTHITNGEITEAEITTNSVTNNKVSLDIRYKTKSNASSRANTVKIEQNLY
jgi:hypothetical protein